MPVGGEDLKTVLHGRGRDPQVVGGDGSPLLTEVQPDGCVSLRGFTINRVDSDPGRCQKFFQKIAISGFKPPSGKTGQQFPEDNRG